MRKTRLIIISTLLILFGCVPSLHELYTDETLVFDPEIAGKWQEEGKELPEGLWEFIPNAESKSYILTIYEKNGKRSRLTAHLVEISGTRFFDFYPNKDTELETGDWVKAHLVAAHLFFRVERTEQKLVVAAMNPETLDKLLKEKPELIKHERLKDSLVLTDSPKNLQAFVLAGLKIKDFFGEPMTLCRLEVKEPKPID